jgi:quinol-cytochrome oxidoreductase complex cytochrome b subunit
VVKEVGDELPDESHAAFPDEWWPHAIMTAAALITLGLLAYAGRSSLASGQPASPGTSGAANPDWYFIFLHELLKLGPPAITTILLPVGGIAVLLVWPLLDSVVGPRLARRLGWRSWPTPRHNPITGALWVVGFVVVVALTLWGLARPGLCLPWFYQGPVCG